MDYTKILGEIDNEVDISIVIPTYKRPNQLKRALKSALTQKFERPFEIMVVDNNPKRGCEVEKLLTDIYNSGSKFLYYKNEVNLGMSGNWNRACALASGSWVLMLHDDDFLMKEYSVVLENYLTEDFDIIAVERTSFQEGESMHYTNGDNSQPTFAVRYRLYDFLFGFRSLAPVGMAIKKSFFERIGGFDDSYYPSVDFEFAVRAVDSGRLIKIRGRALAGYVYGDNVTLKLNTLVGFLAINDKIRKRVLDKIQLLKPLRSVFVRYFKTYDNRYIDSAIVNFGHDPLDVEYLYRDGGLGLRVYKIITKTYQLMFRTRVFFYKVKSRVSYVVARR